MKKILIIGNAGSVWLLEFIRHINFYNKDEVRLITFDQVSEEYKKDYENMNVDLRILGRTGIISKPVKTAKLINGRL